MPDEGILGIFAHHDLVKGLSQRHLMLLASAARPFSANAGEYLARQGQTAHAFYLVQSGKVEMTIATAKGNVTIATAEGPGDVVGWSWLVPPHHWQFDCRVV